MHNTDSHENGTWVDGDGDDFVTIPSGKLLGVNNIPLRRSD